jgi:hypothetical protein
MTAESAMTKKNFDEKRNPEVHHIPSICKKHRTK